MLKIITPKIVFCFFAVFLVLPLNLKATEFFKCNNENSYFESIITLQKKFKTEESLGSTWFSPPTGTEVAVAIVVHGLNNSPLAMNEIAEFLQKHAIKTLRVTLPGHGGNLEAMKKATREDWLETLFVNYCVAKKEASLKNLPLYFVGYSLGALVGLDLVNSSLYLNVNFSASVLFAPAIAPKPMASLFWLLSPFPNLVIPSFNVEEFRANRGTAVRAYNELFRSLEVTLKSGLKNSVEPTTIFISKDDEMVSFDELKKMVEDNPSLNWKIVEINTRDKQNTKFANHLIITNQAMSKESWDELTQLMLKKFGP